MCDCIVSFPDPHTRGEGLGTRLVTVVPADHILCKSLLVNRRGVVLQDYYHLKSSFTGYIEGKCWHGLQ